MFDMTDYLKQTNVTIGDLIEAIRGTSIKLVLSEKGACLKTPNGNCTEVTEDLEYLLNLIQSKRIQNP